MIPVRTMLRCLGLVSVVTLAPAAGAAESPSVAELVKRLGDSRFAVREAAQKELLTRGEGIVPELDRLKQGADAETVERVGKVRYALAGYKDDIRRLVQFVDPPGYQAFDATASAELRGLIARHQPGAGDLLLAVVADRDDRLHDRAGRAFALTWEYQSADQVEAYVRRTLGVVTTQPARFPATVGTLVKAAPQLRFGPAGWPPTSGEEPFAFRARSTLLLDGKPYGQPYENGYTVPDRAWFRVPPAELGKHTVQVELDYSFTHQGVTRTGRLRSDLATLEAVPDDPNDTWGPAPSVDEKNYLRAAFGVIAGYDPGDAGRRIGLGRDPEAFVRWRSTEGQWVSLWCPQWDLTAPLTADLCFEVELRDRRSGKTYAADPIIVPRGQKARGYVIPHDFRAVAQGRSGDVGLDLVLLPSRLVARFGPGVRQSYSEVIEFKRVSFSVVRAAK
jgi:hypothetical protein